MAEAGEFEQWVVPIRDNNGMVRGTGWTITPNAVVTCRHVIENTGYFGEGSAGELLGTIDIGGFEVLGVEHNAERDLAVLRTTPTRGGESDQKSPEVAAGFDPPLTRRSTRGSDIYSHGFDGRFPIENFPAGAPMSIGKLTGPPQPLSVDGREQALYVIDDVDVHEGLSGAPVWDNTLMAVMGVMAKSDHTQRAYVIPISDLLDVWPEFERPEPARPTTTSNTGAVAPGQDVRPPVGLPPRRPTITPSSDTRLVGRDDDLAAVAKMLDQGMEVAVATETKTHAVYGLGGIGKTALALEFCHRTQETFSLVWWVNAEDATTVAASYRELAARLRLPFRDDEEARTRVDEHLHSRQDWLAVFDNVEDQQALASFKPTAGNGKVIATSRNPHGWSSPLELKPIAQDSAVDWLLAAAGSPTDGAEGEAAATIAGELDGLALALAMATSYITSTGCSLAEYLNIYNQELPLSDDDDIPGDYGRSVYTTWNVAVDELNQSNPHAKVLLDYLAFCAPDRIPIRIFTPEALNPQDNAQAQAGHINRAIRGLLQFSLISRVDGYLYIHRLVQQVTRHDLSGTSP